MFFRIEKEKRKEKIRDEKRGKVGGKPSVEDKNFKRYCSGEKSENRFRCKNRFRRE